MSKDHKPPVPPAADAKPPAADAKPPANKQGFNPDTDVKRAEAPFRVAKGKAVTCLAGMLEDGADISADQLGAGAEALEKLVNLGVVVKS